MTDFSEVFCILPMPCGCAAEVLSVVPGPSAPAEVRKYAECPWCGATFLGAEFMTWLDIHSSSPLSPSRGPHPLFKIDGGELLEFAGKRCDCGAPILRKRSGEELHLHLGATLEMVRN